MIDWKQVQTLREEVGPDDFPEVVDLFLQEVDEKIEQISSGRGGTAEEDMHFMKGAASNLGFAMLSKLCQLAETQARNGRDEDIDLGAIFDCFEESRVVFQDGQQSGL
ncbi:MAG: Hpt domain-containing protein [Pseudomonadota bacterium]